MKRFALIFLLMCTLLLTAAHAEPIITIEDDAAGVPDAVVDQIVSDYPDAEAITITRHHTAAQTVLPTAQAEANSFPQPVLLLGPAILAVLTGGLAALCIRHKTRTA